MKVINILSIIIFSSFILIFSSNSYENKILFKVNNEIITSIDILEEIGYLKMINNNLQNLEKEKIFEISKNSLIREKIKIIELSKYFEKLELEQKYINMMMINLVKKLNLKDESELKNYLKNRDLTYENIKEKIIIELLWNQLIITKHSKDIKIDKEKIKKEIQLNNFQKEFLISEILFTLEENEKLNMKYEKIKKDINLNGFENSALMYSTSSSSQSGGKLGWIKLNTLNNKIKEKILNTQIGKITEPIVLPGGFLILKIEDEKITKINLDIEKEIELVAREVTNKQLNQFSNIYFNKIKKEVEINEF